jgi:hypothetical protein
MTFVFGDLNDAKDTLDKNSDWWEIGGAYHKRLRMKPYVETKDAIYGKPNALTPEIVESDLYSDSSKKRDVDMGFLNSKMRLNAKKYISDYIDFGTLNQEGFSKISEELLISGQYDVLLEFESCFSPNGYIYNKQYHYISIEHLNDYGKRLSWRKKFQEFWNSLPDDIFVTVVDVVK